MKAMRHLITVFFLLTISVAGAQTFQQADSAFAAAARLNKSCLLLFSGSDWCPNCRRLEKTVLSNPEFKEYLAENLIFLQADFPQRKKLPGDMVKQNEELARDYNPLGIFPTLVLLSPDRKRKEYVDYENQSPAEFIELLNEKLKIAGPLE